jgi:hypothetical protein
MTRKKLILTIGAAVVVIAGGATALTIWGYTLPPDPKTAKPEEVTKYLASDQFAKLPVEKKQEYFETLHQESQGPPHQMMQAARNLPEKQREKLRENIGSMFMARMEKEIDQYFELPAEQRTAYLDEMIDRHEQFRQQMRNRRPPDNGNDRSREAGADDRQRRRPGGRGRHWTPERHKQMLKHISGERRAKFSEFMEAMRKRRQERGLPERRGPGRR